MDLLREVLFQSYQFLASIRVPGFNISFIQLLFGINAVILSIGFAKIFLGLGGDLISFGINSRQKGGNNKNIKISKERKNDTK